MGLSLAYLLGKSTVREIVTETCKAIWDALSEIYITWPHDLMISSESWYHQNNLPHCVGAVDGKHIRIQKPPKSGAKYFNYKKFYSISLLAVCDADLNFTYVCIGGFGSQSDQSVWTYSALGTALQTDDIDWPCETLLPNSDISYGYFLIGDEGFPLTKYMMRPYSGRNLSQDKTNFNQRISAARSTIERCFGILASRFRIFRSEIAANTKNVELIVQAAVTLHNFINKTRDKNTPQVSDFMPPDSSFNDMPSVRGRTSREVQSLTREGLEPCGSRPL
ncbi:uncharacterized protein LOC129809174 [Phlebotomus papatasi]|uniref:uncharacterized protein LOC129809174 n=1 Tax=Phlebotomus papatasi TaxID=29031 RepID=UPI00248402F7|nr:uncharacterized protein LOC129809174 [Phlebotomus papatasi]